MDMEPIVLSAEAFDELLHWLDEPPTPLPEMVRLFEATSYPTR